MPTGDVTADRSANDPPGLALLRSLWDEVLHDSESPVDDAIHELITCNVVSIRYALLTQLLGKVVDESRDALSIQRGESAEAEESGRWDARSFCNTNVVPWVAESGQVLGTSPEPYVNNPLRRPRLDEYNRAVGSRALWDKLAELLTEIQRRSCLEFTRSKLRACLVSLAIQYRQLAIPFAVPQRISWERTSTLVADFLQESSGGERPQIITAALMRTIGERFGIFDSVARQAINEADSANAMPGDVICYLDSSVVLSIEVKDRTVEILDVDSAIEKARRSGVTEYLFATVNPPSDDSSLTARAESEFALGTNIYRISIDDLLRTSLSISGETSRVRFLELVGEELNDRVTQPSHKLAWQSLLRQL